MMSFQAFPLWRWLQKSVALIVPALLMHSCQAAISSDLPVDSLNERVAKRQYLEAAGDIYARPEVSSDVLAWLEKQAQAGIPPLQYELSRRIWDTQAEEALKWYARGYVARSLDFSQCADRANNQLYMLMLGMYSPLRDRALAQPKRYAGAMEDAIRWNEERSQPPGPEWICRKGVLPEPLAKQARDKQLQEVREGIERLKAR